MPGPITVRVGVRVRRHWALVLAGLLLRLVRVEVQPEGRPPIRRPVRITLD